jgi:hypothetical protein
MIHEGDAAAAPRDHALVVTLSSPGGVAPDGGRVRRAPSSTFRART